jgi:hypothetical protein
LIVAPSFIVYETKPSPREFKMKKCSIIRDGYTEEGYAADEFAGYPGIHFKYRPFTVDEAEELLEESKPLTGKSLLILQANYLKDHLVSWNAADEKGIVTIDETNLRLLIPRQFFRILRIVCGHQPSDIDPNSTAAEQAEQLKKQVAHEKGDSQVVRVEQDLSN